MISCRAMSGVLFAVGFLAMGGPVVGDSTWERDIVISPAEPGVIGPRLIAIPLDASLLKNTPDIATLSVYDDLQRAIPAIVHERTGTTRRRTDTVARIEKLDVAAHGSGSLKLTIQLPDKFPVPTAFRLETPLRDFERSVSIWAVTGDQETPVATNQPVFDISRHMDVRRLDVPVERSSARTFRIEISAPSPEQSAKLAEWTLTLAKDGSVGKTERFTPVDQPFKLERILAVSTREETVAASRLEREVPCRSEPVTSDPARKDTAIRLLTDNVPFDRLVVETSSVNFSRPVRVFLSRRGKKKADWVVSGQLTRLRYGEIDESRLEIPLRSASRVDPNNEELLLQIENGDSPPLVVERVRAFGPDLQLVFLAEAGRSYRVRFGTQGLQRHDRSALSRLLNTGHAPELVQLAGEAKAVVGTPQPRAGFWNSPWILGPVVGLAVAGFAWALYRAMGRIDVVAPVETSDPAGGDVREGG
jgi:hypothetical protein